MTSQTGPFSRLIPAAQVVLRVMDDMAAVRMATDRTLALVSKNPLQRVFGGR
jgi:hypothetical protein